MDRTVPLIENGFFFHLPLTAGCLQYLVLFKEYHIQLYIKKNMEAAMTERNDAATFQGNPLTLIGPEIKAGDSAPAFNLIRNDLSPAGTADFAGKVLVIATVPSLDTPVCDTETRRFNTEAAALGDGVQVLAVSMDLPFAQARWCGAAGIDAVETLSDYKDAAMAESYGVLIKELRLMTRAVFVVDQDGTVRYAEYVKEITEEPDYDAALQAVRGLVG
jgi:thiol peroxidase